MRLALEGAFETTTPQTTATSSAKGGRLAWIVAAVAVFGMIALAVPALQHLRDTPRIEMTPAHLTLDLAPADRLGPTSLLSRPNRTALAISPDGATVVFSGEISVPSGTPVTMLYRRPLAQAQSVAVPGTEGAEYPFFSPDGQWVGFAAGTD